MRDRTTGLITAVIASIKLLKYAKFALVPISLLGSLVAYGLTLGWVFGAILVGVLFVHEMGHVVAARRVGIKVSAPYFIPFMGALILANREDLKGEKHSYMAAGGPFFGTVLAALCMAAYWVTGSQHKWILAAAAVGAVLNLFNMLPVRPLDGGRFFDNALPRVGRGFSLGLMILGLVMKDAVLCFIALVMVAENFNAPWRKRIILPGIIMTELLLVLTMPWWAIALIGPLYAVLLYFMADSMDEYEKQHGKEEPGKMSRKWLAIWLSLTIILIVLAALSLPGIPQT